MPSGYAIGRDPVLMKTLTWRQRAGRRWLAVVCAILGLALVSGVIGSLIRPAHTVSSRPATGPFSYFPSL